jgi:hypothetical protein
VDKYFVIPGEPEADQMRRDIESGAVDLDDVFNAIDAAAIRDTMEGVREEELPE